MEIKRKVEKLTAKKRQYVIRQSPNIKQSNCGKCGKPNLTTEQAAVFFGVSQRRIFQIIETKAVHFSEIESSSAMICLTSLAEFFEIEKSLDE